MAIYEFLYIKNKIKQIPEIIYTLKFIGIVVVMLTILVTALFLALTSKYSYFSFFQNSNLFFHFVISLISMISFIFFEKYSLSYKKYILGIVPMVIYGIFYTINVLQHVENGYVSYEYDWYGFLKGGVSITVIVFIFMFIITFVISFIILWLNLNNSTKS